jgi:hypothetical protein
MWRDFDTVVFTAPLATYFSDYSQVSGSMSKLADISTHYFSLYTIM